MSLDLATLRFALATIAVAAAGALVLQWRLDPRAQGAAAWTLGGAAWAAGAVLGAARDVAPPGATLAGVLLVLGHGGFLAGASQATGRRRFRGPAIAAPAITAALLVALALHPATEPLRVAVVSLAAALLAGLCAAALLGRSEPDPPSSVQRLTGLVFGLHALFLLGHAALSAAGAAGRGPGHPSPLDVAGAIEAGVATVAWTAGIALLAVERLRRELDHVASHDPVTEAYNRRAFLALAEREMARVRRYGQRLSLLMIDVDRLRAVNERWGHGTGDEVLRRVAAQARARLRSVDVFCRYGGGEFAALLPSTSTERAATVAERLRAAVAGEPVLVGDSHVSVTVSIGVAEVGIGDETLDTLLQKSDSALATAKERGRDQVAVFSG